jgi:hypothetical protein
MTDILPITYHPLKDDEIRIVALQPWIDDDTVQCHILHMTIATAKEQGYEALSYTWGSPESPRAHITIDGASCEVRENLQSALYHLRRKGEVRHIWIDALCINQSDNLERSFQVSQMARIYQEAGCVAVWLGTPSPEGVNVFTYVTEIISNGVPGMKDEDYVGKLTAWFDAHTEKWNEVVNMCKRPYWTRLWIVQEFTFAAHARLYYGSMAMDAYGLRRATTGVVLLRDTYLGRDTELLNRILNAPYTNLMIGLDILREQKKQDPSTNTLLSVSFCLDQSHCSEMLDKIFALHSLATPCCRAAVPVDYSKTLPELCIELIEHHLVQYGTDDIVYLGR